MRNLFFTLILLLPFSCVAQCDESANFDRIDSSKEWTLELNDKCTGDWQENWFLDGLKGTIETSRKGMHFSAGPEARNNDHHAVLWTKESFEGDIKIEYDYTRTDSAINFVTLLYIQATGYGEGEYVEDIAQWSDLRKSPFMRYYFDYMNLLHISYAAFGNDDNDDLYYVRARKYPKPKGGDFDKIKLKPSYDYEGFVKTGQRYHITAIKSEGMLYFKMQSKDGVELFSWDLSGVEPVTEGRIGLRHMASRSAIYKNIKIYTKTK